MSGYPALHLHVLCDAHSRRREPKAPGEDAPAAARALRCSGRASSTAIRKQPPVHGEQASKGQYISGPCADTAGRCFRGLRPGAREARGRMARRPQALSAPWPYLFPQISRGPRRHLRRALHHLWIRPLLGRGRGGTFPPWATAAGATSPPGRARPSIHHTNPPRARGTPSRAPCLAPTLP